MMPLSVIRGDGVYLKLASVLSYAKWANKTGLENGVNDGLSDDPDGDRISNGLEMYLGSDPLVPEQGLLPTMEKLSLLGVEYLSVELQVATAHNSRRSQALRHPFDRSSVLVAGRHHCERGLRSDRVRRLPELSFSACDWLSPAGISPTRGAPTVNFQRNLPQQSTWPGILPGQAFW